MVQLSTLFVLALSALSAVDGAALHNTPRSSIHHRAIVPRAQRACRDKVVPKPKYTIDPIVNDDDGTGSASATKKSSASSTKGSAPSKTSKSGSSSSSNDDDDDNSSSGQVGTGSVNSGSINPIVNAASVLPLGPGVATASTAQGSGSHKLNPAFFNAFQTGRTGQYGAFSGKDAVKVDFDKGSLDFRGGGISIYGKTPVDLTKGKTVTFSYSVFFEEGFNFNKGGKLPGLMGGIDQGSAAKCSGGNHGFDASCFSFRMMWRTGGAGELYAYLTQTKENEKALQSITPGVGDNAVYGISVGRGKFHWKTGAWTRVTQIATLNTPGKYDGKIEILVDGQHIFTVTGLLLRKSASSQFHGIQVQSFFGGHEEDWASPKKQSLWFADFAVGVYN